MKNSFKKIADEMLELLLKTLSTEFSHLKQLKDNENYYEFLKQLHKLHGAVCYCDVPELRKSIQALETALKQNNFSDIPLLFTDFENQIFKLLKV